MTDMNLTPGSGGDAQDAPDNGRPHGKPENMSEEQFQHQMRQAALLLAKGEGRAALPLLERCFKHRPDDPDVLTNLGGAYILAEKHRYAVPILEEASEIEPHNPAVWSNLAAAYLGKLVTATRERQEAALQAYQRVIELEPHYPNVHYNMGLIFIDRRDWESAYGAFTRALESNPHDNDAQNMRARVEQIMNQPPDPLNN